MNLDTIEENHSSTSSPHSRASGWADAPWPYFSADEVHAAADVLRSGKVNYWTGSEGKALEKEFAEFTGCRYAVALANGTVALEAALRGLGIGPGDEVITTSRTFIASASCAVAVGARPVMADVDRVSQNITAETIGAVMSSRTKGIVAVHLAGWPCDMDAILALARESGVFVIEDCAQAQGALYQGRPVGSLGDVAAFSFCQDKIMTTGGEGGMLTTNDQEIWRKAWSYKDHGKSIAAMQPTPQASGFRWLHDSFGSNGRMTEMQAAIGRVALRKVPGWLATRRRFANMLTNNLSSVPGLRVPRPASAVEHAYYKYYAFVCAEQLRSGWNRDRILAAINDQGVPCSVGSCSEIYRERAFSPAWCPAERFPVARELGDSSLMFLIHPTLTDEHIRQTYTAVRKVMAEAATPIRVSAAGAGAGAGSLT